MFFLFLYLLFTLVQLLLTSITLPIPFNDSGTVRYKSFPWMTLLLIAVNSIVYCFLQMPDEFAAYRAETDLEVESAIINFYSKIWTYGFRESFVTNETSIGAFTTFTSMFMHVDITHLIGNMIYLWAFGRRIEDACGPWRYLVFYLFAGMVATLGYAVLTAPEIEVPGVGASGAIAGVQGAYLLLFPAARMDCLWMPAVIIKGVIRTLMRLVGSRPEDKWRWLTRMPAIIVLALFIGDNLLPTFYTVGTGEFVGGVNYVAHMTGFLSAVLIFLFVRKDLLTRYMAGRSF